MIHAENIMSTTESGKKTPANARNRERDRKLSGEKIKK